MSKNIYGHSALVDEAAHLLISRGYNIIYNSSSLSKLSIPQSILQLTARGVDGIIFYDYDDVKSLNINQTVPYMFFSDKLDVGIDREYGGYMATKHLLEHGHNKVLLMMIQSWETQHPRYSGWQRAHAEAGIEVGHNDVIILRELNGCVNKVVDCLKRKKVTAVYAFNDYIGAKLITVLLQNNIRVPEDIAVIGNDGHSFTEFFPIPLTTVITPVRPQAEIGVELFLERVKKKELHSPPAKHLIKPVLHIGASCGCKVKPIKNFYRFQAFDMLEKDAKMNFDIDIIHT